MNNIIIEHRPTDLPDTRAIDFELRDKDTGELLASVWGNSLSDLQVDCSHDLVEFTDEDERGTCAICGATCDWHRVNDTCEVEGIVQDIQTPEPIEWYDGEVGGIIKEYIKEQYDIV